ncbi:hypothetical protein ANSO36C_57330 [Nostoc cf. commune SO-36]|uniref:SCP domain-containing protein n=1 Tax=Nostoc cf. commune SO-36 TaxID=449208 RepID=A0ABM7Z9L6_NOSCO|nr:hypothetical protein ANSO36C_57330 [Nostoc cf. commune SO-36]
MIKTTIGGVALVTIILSSSAIATPVTNSTFMPISSHLSNTTVEIAASSIDSSAIEQSVFTQINNYRVSQGLAKLTRNSDIDTQARIHSKNMANGTVAFGHTGFTERVKAIGITYNAAAEKCRLQPGIY